MLNEAAACSRRPTSPDSLKYFPAQMPSSSGDRTSSDTADSSNTLDEIFCSKNRQVRMERKWLYGYMPTLQTATRGFCQNQLLKACLRRSRDYPGSPSNQNVHTAVTLAHSFAWKTSPCVAHYFPTVVKL